jgi:hypothetical protein
MHVDDVRRAVCMNVISVPKNGNITKKNFKLKYIYSVPNFVQRNNFCFNLNNATEVFSARN